MKLSFKEYLRAIKIWIRLVVFRQEPCIVLKWKNRDGELFIEYKFRFLSNSHQSQYTVRGSLAYDKCSGNPRYIALSCFLNSEKLFINILRMIDYDNYVHRNSCGFVVIHDCISKEELKQRIEKGEFNA